MTIKRWFPVAALVFVPHAWGACTVSATGVGFGTFNPFAGGNIDSTGNVAATCSPGAPYTIALSPGDGGNQMTRTMKSGAKQLSYNLFTDATRSIVWGDGTGASQTVSGSGTAGSHTIYGRIAVTSTTSVGSYADAIIVTVTF